MAGVSVRHGEVWNRPRVLAAVRREPRKGLSEVSRHRDEGCRRKGCQIGNCLKAPHSLERVVERCDPAQRLSNLVKNGGGYVRGVHEWIQDGDVRGHAELSCCIEAFAQVTDESLGRRHFDDECRSRHTFSTSLDRRARACCRTKNPPRKVSDEIPRLLKFEPLVEVCKCASAPSACTDSLGQSDAAASA